jgi:hypothetical protein
MILAPAALEQDKITEISYFGDESSGSVSPSEVQIKFNTFYKNLGQVPKTEKSRPYSSNDRQHKQYTRFINYGLLMSKLRTKLSVL